MTPKIQTQPVKSDSKDVVLNFINALNNEDFETARNCLDPAMVFDDTCNHIRGVEDYIRDLKKLKFKYKIKKMIEDGDYVCLIYDINMAGKNVFTCGCYQLKNGKINLIKVIFDPSSAPFKNIGSV